MLARELHPDVSEAPDAEERFKEAVEAYEVLSKSETRELYDRFGHAGLRSGGFRPTTFDFGSLSDIFAAFFGEDLLGATMRGQARGGDIAAEVSVELTEAATGVKRDVPFRAAVSCAVARRPASSGSAGRHVPDVRRPRPDPACLAERLRRVHPHPGLPLLRRVGAADPDAVPRLRRARPRSRGADARRRDTAGHPRRPADAPVGRGARGRQGGRPGDVYVRVHVRPDERFVREGDDIFSTVDLTMIQAALGATVVVPTLDGEAELEFEPGTQPGEVVVLRGRGMPVLQGFGRGDHRVLVNVAVPHRLTEEQRALLEQFERSAGDETYKPDEGFFEKLKSAFR